MNSPSPSSSLATLTGRSVTLIGDGTVTFSCLSLSSFTFLSLSTDFSVFGLKSSFGVFFAFSLFLGGFIKGSADDGWGEGRPFFLALRRDFDFTARLEAGGTG